MRALILHGQAVVVLRPSKSPLNIPALLYHSLEERLEQIEVWEEQEKRKEENG